MDDTVLNRCGKRPLCVIHTVVINVSAESQLFLQNVEMRDTMFLQLNKSHSCFLNHQSWMTCHCALRSPALKLNTNVNLG